MLPFEGSDLLIGRLEQEVNTAPYTGNLIPIVQDSILAVEVLSRCYDVLCESVVSTELPAIQGRQAVSTKPVIRICVSN